MPKKTDDWGGQVQGAHAVLEAAGDVLAARRRLDDLVLAVLAAPGLAVPQVADLSEFLVQEWLPSLAAGDRLAAAAGER